MKIGANSFIYKKNTIKYNSIHNNNEERKRQMELLTVKKSQQGYVLENGLELVCDNSVDYPIAMVNGDEIVLTTALLHLHTGYSLLDGAIKTKSLVNLATTAENKTMTVDGKTVVFATYPYVSAITDHGNIFGAYEFGTKLAESGMKPIIGCEVYLETIGGKKKGNHLILLCKNKEGYHNLCKILSLAEENFYNKPHVKWDVLRAHSKGLVCLSACLGGEVPNLILRGDLDGAMEVAENFLDIFGEDFYIEIQNHHLADEDKVRPSLVRLAKELGVKTVCTTDSHYLLEESKQAHEILLCVQTGKTLSDPSHFRFDGDGYHVPTNKELCELFSFLKESIANQAEIVKKCEFNFSKTEITMPVFPTGDKTIEELFVEECWKGFHERFDDSDVDIDAYKERLEYEMGVISQMKFQAYFLIVADFIKYAKDNHIAVGPGRGSAVGSLVAYSLKITDLDPIPYGLLFERFLNPERVSMPDIDIDFQDTRRQEVIDYVKAKYGAECVSRIITFGTLAARLVVRDVARAMGISPILADKAAKAIPAEPKMTIDKALKKSLEFQELYKDPQIKQIVDIARQLEGLPRHKSQHACGVVISAKPVDEFVPEVLLEDSNGQVARTAAFTMTELEELGLLKMDFLGLRNMGIIKNACDSIGITEKVIPLTDPYVYRDILAPAATDGIFQVEGGGMKGLMKDMFWDVKSRVAALEKQYGVSSYAEVMTNKAAADAFNEFGRECFERLIAAISLYRPGPMDYIPQYIAGMRNPKTIHYDTPKLESILGNTYGVIVYQEQVQQIVRDLAGYSLGRGDIIRRAMGKKKQEMMDKEKEVFLNGNRKDYEAGKEKQLVPGCHENGVSEEAANTIWQKMSKFAEYAFNKSHSAGYAVISIQTAWIKKYYPTQFWCETMNSVITKSDKLKKYIASAKASGMKLLSPDINMSVENFSIVDEGKIRMGLIGLRNVGKSSGPIVAERKKNGKFTSFEDFVSRLMPDKRYYESLVYSGALDCFAGSRRAKIQAQDSIADYKKAMSSNNAWFNIPELDEWYNSFFKIEVPDVDEMDDGDKLEKEYHYAGMYVSAHPLDQYAVVASTFNRVPISELTEDDEEGEDSGVKVEQERAVTVIGVVKELERKLTKKGDAMYVFRIEDETGDIRTTMFPKEVDTYGDIVHENAVIRIDGTWKDNDFGVQIVVSNVVELAAIKNVVREQYVLLGNTANLKDIIATCDKYADKTFSAIKVLVRVNGKNYAISNNPASTKRAIEVTEGVAIDDDSIVKVSSSLEAFAAIREVAKIL